MDVSMLRLSSGRVSISTPRLLLRAAVESDAEHMHKVFSDPEVVQYTERLPHEELSKSVRWVLQMMDSPANGVSDFIVCLKPDLIPIGKMGVWQGDEIGFMLAREHWRRGIAREILSAELPYFFAATDEGGRGFEKIMADVDPRNEACIRFLTSFGFEQTGFEENTFEIGGQWVDSVYLELSKTKWQAMQ